MTLSQFLIPPICSFFLFLLAFVLGYFVLGKINARRNDFLFNLSSSVLLGYGILGYFVLLLSYLGILNKISIFIFALLTFFFCYRSLSYFYNNLKKTLKSIFRQSSLNKILLGFLIFLIIAASLSAFMPPYRGDAIAYHLPEAKIIAKNGISKEGWNLSLVQPFVASFPLLMEAIYALGITIYDFTLAHLTHYQIFLMLILAVYVFLRKRFTKTQGFFGCILIFTIFELVVNSTVAYVDAAVVSFNIVGLLVFIDWFFSNKKSSLALSALFFGLAASVKYGALYTLVIIAFLFLFKIIFIDKKRIPGIIKTGLLFSGFWLIAGGFWYLKNLIFHLNPFYPFFFNYLKTTENSFVGVMSKIGKFEFRYLYPRTLWGFLTMPFRAFKEPHYYPILLAFLVLPLIFLVKKLDLIQKNKKVIVFLFIYLFSFFAVWYFVGVQIRRYAMEGQVILMLLAAIILGTILLKITERIKLVWLIILIIFVSIPLFFTVARYENSYLFEYEKLQISYLFGIKDKYDFYRFQNSGEEFFVSEYINGNLQNEKIINNLCLDEGNFFLDKNNQFVWLRNLAIDENKDLWLQLSEYLKKNNINYLFVSWEEKEKNYSWKTGACTIDWQEYKDKFLLLENLIKKHSELIFSNKDKGVELYKLNIEY